MKLNKKPSVLCCVTSQYDCDRLINASYEIATKNVCDLHVLCVHNRKSNVAYLSDEIEYLYQTSKSLGADMTIFFDDNAPKITADFAKKINARVVVTGVPDNMENGFVDTVSKLLPNTQITMVTKQNEFLTYRKEQVRALA